jgi:hypothetical protein
MGPFNGGPGLITCMLVKARTLGRDWHNTKTLGIAQNTHLCITICGTLFPPKSQPLLYLLRRENRSSCIESLGGMGRINLSDIAKKDAARGPSKRRSPISTGRKPPECRLPTVAENFRDKTRYLHFHQLLRKKRALFRPHSK